MNNILLLSADSDIAKSCAKLYAKAGNTLILAGRNEDALNIQANKLVNEYNIQAYVLHYDALETSEHESFVKRVLAIGELDGLLCFTGLLGCQNQAQSDFSHTQTIINTNFSGLVSTLELFAAYFQTKQSGFIIGLSSVAGERGRQSNYIYGASKAAFSCYLSGLRNRLHQYNISVLTVKAGFVKTKMTQNMNLLPWLTSTPDEVALAVFKAQKKQKNTLYVKPAWRGIMFFIRLIPEPIFKRMSL